MAFNPHEGFTSSIPKPKPKPKPQSSVYQGPPSGSGSTTSTSYGQNNAQQQLAAIVANKQENQNKRGLSSINESVVGQVFGGADPNQIPYHQMNEAQKVFANFYGSSTPNLYQQQIHDFITTSPENMQTYKDSGLKGAGLNAFMTTAPAAIASNTMFGNILKNLKSTPGKIKESLSGIYNTPQVQNFLGLTEEKEDEDLKSSYSEYMNEMNEKVGASRADTPQGEDLDIFDVYTENYEMADRLPQTKEIPTDKDIQNEIERSLINQYSLIDDTDLATSLLDKSMQTDEEIQDLFIDKNQSFADLDQQTLDNMVGAYIGVPGPINDDLSRKRLNLLLAPQDTGYVSNNDIVDVKVGEDEGVMADMPSYYNAADASFNYPYNQDEFPKVKEYPFRDSEGVIQEGYYNPTGADFLSDFGIRLRNNYNDVIFSDVISDTPKVGEEIRSADFSNLGYKDGGSLNTYEVLKLINDTMHDG